MFIIYLPRCSHAPRPCLIRNPPTAPHVQSASAPHSWKNAVMRMSSYKVVILTVCRPSAIDRNFSGFQCCHMGLRGSAMPSTSKYKYSVGFFLLSAPWGWGLSRNTIPSRTIRNHATVDHRNPRVRLIRTCCVWLYEYYPGSMRTW